MLNEIRFQLIKLYWSAFVIVNNYYYNIFWFWISIMFITHTFWLGDFIIVCFIKYLNREADSPPLESWEFCQFLCKYAPVQGTFQSAFFGLNSSLNCAHGIRHKNSELSKFGIYCTHFNSWPHAYFYLMWKPLLLRNSNFRRMEIHHITFIVGLIYAFR